MTRVSIVGGNGAIGKNLALLFGNAGFVDHVTLVGRNLNGVQGVAEDTQHAYTTLGSPARISGAALDDPKAYEADVVVVAAGEKRGPGMTRADLVAKNAPIIRQVGENILTVSPDAFVVVLSNPLDAMTHLMHDTMQRDSRKVVGMAGILDSARFRTEIASELGVHPRDVHAEVLGEHGDSMVPLFSRVQVNGAPIMLDLGQQERILVRAKSTGQRIIQAMGTSANAGPAAGALSMIRAHVQDTGEVFPVSARFDGQYGLRGIFMGVHARIDAQGAHPQHVQINQAEIAALHRSAQAVRAVVNEIPRPDHINGAVPS